VEAATWLDRAGLLKDSTDRPGKALRELLRAGKILGQRQDPNRRWFIRRTDADVEHDQPTVASPVAATDAGPAGEWEALRRKYRPEKVRLLLVGESPPVGGGLTAKRTENAGPETPSVHGVHSRMRTNGGCESGRRIAPGEPLTQGGSVGGLDVPGHRYPVVLTDQLRACRVVPPESLRKILYVKPPS